MVLFGVKFEETKEDINKYVALMRGNTNKQAVNVLFNMEVFVVEPFILVIWKEFIPLRIIMIGLSFMAFISIIPMIMWGVVELFIIFLSLLFLIMLIETPYFNFILFKMMLKRYGYKGKVRLL